MEVDQLEVGDYLMVEIQLVGDFLQE
jgi:ERCC4-type nuclease